MSVIFTPAIASNAPQTSPPAYETNSFVDIFHELYEKFNVRVVWNVYEPYFVISDLQKGMRVAIVMSHVTTCIK